MSTPEDGLHTRLGPGAEFDTIRQLVERWGDLATGIGNDAAELSFALGAMADGRQLVVSTDACVEDAHFREGWLTPEEVGGRAMAAALSDLAAMGARADAVLLAFIVPDHWRARLAEVADGIANVLRPTGAKIVGGNVTKGALFSITSTVIGSALHPVSRSAVFPGDRLLVTGTLGGPGRALAALDAGAMPDAWSRGRFASPVPRLSEGEFLASAGVMAMLDVSDGLVGDARHLAAASHMHIRLDARRVPRGPLVAVNEVLESGEEYELLFTASAALVDQLLIEWPKRFALPLTVIGEAVGIVQGDVPDSAGDGVVEVVGLTDATGRVEFVRGHDHFSR